MKLARRIMACALAVAVAISTFAVAPINTEAAAPKKNTYVLDSKKGVAYPTKVRAGIMGKYNTEEVYLINEGDYVSGVKSNSSDLIVKLTKKSVYTGNQYSTNDILGNGEGIKCKAYYTITFYAKKKGTYNVTVTVKNAKKKTTCKKKIKVYAEEYSYPVNYCKYAGKLCDVYNLTNKKSGKIKVKMNKGFKLQKIEVGTYAAGKTKEYDPEPVFKKVKNNSKISLATSTKYQSDVYEYSYGDGDYSYERGYDVEYLYPITIVRITYKDTKLGTVQTIDYDLFYQNK